MSLGSIFILLGVLGSFLPILQGWLFFLIGIFILARDVPFFARIAAWLRRRFPRTASTADRIRERIHHRGIGHLLKDRMHKDNGMHLRRESYLPKKKEILGLVGWFVLCFGIAWIGSLAGQDQWYADLRRSPFNPPDWVFPVVWTILYALMAIAAWLVWKKKGFLNARIPLGLFFLQLILNGLWPWLFFEFHEIGWAFADIVALWIFLALTLASFWVENPPAGVLLVPYLGWISYAAFLNYIIWRIN